MRHVTEKECAEIQGKRPGSVQVSEPFDFGTLVGAIREVHAFCAVRAGRAVNVSLTMRNWLIGRYIREFEQSGTDRAAYGARLLGTLADELRKDLDLCYTGRYLGLCRQLYDVYPAIGKSVISEFAPPVLAAPPHERAADIRKSPISECSVESQVLIDRLSFTHLPLSITAYSSPSTR